MNFLICLRPAENRGSRFRTKIVKKLYENSEKMRPRLLQGSPKTHENRKKMRVR